MQPVNMDWWNGLPHSFRLVKLVDSYLGGQYLIVGPWAWLCQIVLIDEAWYSFKSQNMLTAISALGFVITRVRKHHDFVVYFVPFFFSIDPRCLLLWYWWLVWLSTFKFQIFLFKIGFADELTVWDDVVKWMYHV